MAVFGPDSVVIGNDFWLDIPSNVFVKFVDLRKSQLKPIDGVKCEDAMLV